jgi:antitoxin HicB
MKKTLENYLKLPYTRELIPEPEGGWFVRIKELPGCISQGDTPDEALASIDDALRGWLKVSIDSGDLIPEPRDEEGFSGKFMVRLPRFLHKRLVEQAQEEGVSLNQYVNTILALAVNLPLSLWGADRNSLYSLPAELIQENHTSYSTKAKSRARIIPRSGKPNPD